MDNNRSFLLTIEELYKLIFEYKLKHREERFKIVFDESISQENIEKLSDVFNSDGVTSSVYLSWY